MATAVAVEKDRDQRGECGPGLETQKDDNCVLSSKFSITSTPKVTLKKPGPGDIESQYRRKPTSTPKAMTSYSENWQRRN